MLTEIPDAILMKIPNSFFLENKISFQQFIDYYKRSPEADPAWCFYHFISRVPVHKVTHCYLCFDNIVQMKVIIVQFLHNQPLDLPGYSHPHPRDWMIATGPITTPTERIPAYKGRGFRYTKHLF